MNRNTAPESKSGDDPFAGYQVEGFFDEIFEADGAVRPPYKSLVARLRAIASEELGRRERLRDAIFRSLGITFAVYGEAAGVERVWPMDLVPRIIPAEEWAPVERGLIQRVTALNRFLDDIYVGEQAAIADGIVPRALVMSADGFEREAFGIAVPHAARCMVSGVDLVRDGEGVYRVLEDNLRTPSGISYVLENRATLTRVLPLAFAQHRVRPVSHYPASLLTALRSVAPAAAGNPRVVVLTPGAYNSAYFEHAFLARQMGVELVEGRDLVVDEHVVYLRTTRGLDRVDVVYRRIDDDYPRSRRLPQRLDTRRSGHRRRRARRQRHHRQRGRERRRRRQGDLCLRAGAHPILPRRGADPAERRDLSALAGRTARRPRSSVSISWSSSRWRRRAATASSSARGRATRSSPSAGVRSRRTRAGTSPRR